ncbi:unnamed protein product [Trichogramma brassicae]|uniref:Uncharacterized protein n=1 Tax=Trichogramma brassicae TaxID=86971 RepID=A0A6H5IVP7_9HYME|nr:unnamed protein product [Trichogramma brassicae]
MKFAVFTRIRAQAFHENRLSRHGLFYDNSVNFHPIIMKFAVDAYKSTRISEREAQKERNLARMRHSWNFIDRYSDILPGCPEARASDRWWHANTNNLVIPTLLDLRNQNDDNRYVTRDGVARQPHGNYSRVPCKSSPSARIRQCVYKCHGRSVEASVADREQEIAARTSDANESRGPIISRAIRQHTRSSLNNGAEAAASSSPLCIAREREKEGGYVRDGLAVYKTYIPRLFKDLRERKDYSAASVCVCARKNPRLLYIAATTTASHSATGSRAKEGHMQQQLCV